MRPRNIAPIEVAAIMGALVKLEYRDFRVYDVLTRRAREDVARYGRGQLAQVVHALSMVHPEWIDAFEELAVPLQKRMGKIDSVTALLVLAAYARAKVSPGDEFMDRLLSRLEPGLSEMTDQGLVTFVYAMGRLHIQPPLLADALILLEARASTLNSQHVANSLYAMARLGFDDHACTKALFGRIMSTGSGSTGTGTSSSSSSTSSSSSSTGTGTGIPSSGTAPSLVWEPQHVANILAASVVLPLSRSSNPALLPTFAHYICHYTTKFSPQLLASVASSVAGITGIGESQAHSTSMMPTDAKKAFFQAIGDHIRVAEKPGEHVSSDALVAFIHAKLFHEPLFSWALEDLLQRANAPLELMCKAGQAILYTDFNFHEFIRIDGIDAPIRSSLFFPQASEGFQHLCEKFIRQLGQILLSRSKHVYMESVHGLADGLAATTFSHNTLFVPF